jgi:calcineurin-like phosphoesterase family protein
MSNIWITSDWHYGHENSLLFRPQFRDLEEMHNLIKYNFLSVVKPGDRVFFAGDFALGNTTKVFYDLHLPGDWSFVRGNHDRWKQKSNYPWLKDEVIDSQPITISHYAMMSWNKSHYGAWLIYGHHHGIKDVVPGKTLNVCLEHHDYKPWSWEEVKEYMKNRSDNWDTIKKDILVQQ